MKVVIRPSCQGDVAPVCALMRQADRDELVAMWPDRTPLDLLQECFTTSSRSWTALIDGEPVCMFGVIPMSILTGRGWAWMLGTDMIEQFPRTFLRRCRRCLKSMQQVYSVLENYVDDRNEVSKKWLSWLGFGFAESTIVTPSGVNFRHFKLEGGG